jgi:homoserine kinase type II
MAVYTEVSDEELAAFIAGYELGEPISFKGIAEGVENSNYLVQTDKGAFILTLYEKRVKPADLPFFLTLMEHLAGKGIACPTPIHGKDGIALRKLCGRPAALVTFLDGMWPRRITPAHCTNLGEAMAQMHIAARDFPLERANDLSVAGWKQLFNQLQGRADKVLPGIEAEITKELAALEEQWPSGLPTGIVHADLFPDNVFFLGQTLSGLIDFYFSCTDFLAYDIAVCLNAWCFEADSSFNVTKAQRLLLAYQRVRPLSPPEIEALPWLARGAALRFLLTRLYDWLDTPQGALVRPKDPLEFARRLRFHQACGGPAAYGLN